MSSTVDPVSFCGAVSQERGEEEQTTAGGESINQTRSHQCPTPSLTGEPQLCQGTKLSLGVPITCGRDGALQISPDVLVGRIIIETYRLQREREKEEGKGGSQGEAMSRQRLPLIGCSGGKTIKAKAKPTVPSAQRPLQTRSQKRSRQHTSVLVCDSSMAPWGGLDLSESSFTSLSPPRPPSAPPPPPPVPHTTPASPHRTRRHTRTSSTSTINSNMSSPSPVAAQDTGGVAVHNFCSKRRTLPQRRVPRPPRLPPLRQVTNLSFSRSFTFSFFELPLYQSPRCRAERTKNLLLLIKQVHF
ncbi:hypothetical protein WMY93_027738 [Mugilogobius chulae]|uniref:Uncharacterized protein n=1 Tax=Mugilogobius chulae TaxID=88201 RepID=A0AAW0N2S4_9GOBI